MISGSGVVEIWKASIFEEVGWVGVGSGDGVSGMVVSVGGFLGGLLVGMEFLWVTRLGELLDELRVIFVQSIPSKFCANDI